MDLKILKIPLLLICAGAYSVLADPIILQPSTYSVEQFQDIAYSVSCEARGAQEISWYSPRETFISESRTNDIFVEKMDKGNKLQLRFQKLKMQHSGVYTCVAKINGHDERRSFNLTVIRPITFADKTHVFYAPIGGNATLLCEADSYPPPTITWTKNDSKIEGPDYMYLADGLYITNVTEDKLGNYTCSAFLITSSIGATKKINLELKLARSPKIISSYKNNTVLGIMNSVANIRCNVSADPSASIKWYRNGKELSLRDYNATIQNKDNESILQLYLSNRNFLGSYTCEAKNSLNTTSETFILKEGQLPDVPSVSVRNSQGHTLQLDITPNNTQQLSHYLVLYKKLSEANTSDWIPNSLELKNSSTNPYWVNDLEANTNYVYKVGACSQIDLCSFTNELVVYMEPAHTGSASTIHTVLTQVLILLPAFLLNFITRRYQST